MKFDRGSCLGFLVGFFVLSPLLQGIIGGSMRMIINSCMNGIIGIGMAILFGLWFGRKK